MKKKFTIHLDALLVVLILFFSSLALNYFQQSQVTALTEENSQLQWKGIEDSMNLSSQEKYIKTLKAKLNNEAS